MEMVYRRRWLPHQDVEGHPVFITACLEGSISAAGLRKIRDYRRQLALRPKPDGMDASEWVEHQQKLLFAMVDQLLDGESAVEHLKDPRQAEIVQNAFLHFADRRYKLLAFVVMPSHHHWLFLPDPDWSAAAVKRSQKPRTKNLTPREIISHSIQSYTATQCNRARGSSGAYWQHETFDHWARDEDQAIRIVRYIENNPVKAGLVKASKEYRWSSARLRAERGIEPGQPIHQ
jgi:REP element-mobilizing transposase RayT